MRWAWLLLAALGCARASTLTFAILHTNDFHGYLDSFNMTVGGKVQRVGGAARLVHCERLLRAAAQDALVLDAGDAMLAAPPTAQLSNGSAVIEVYNARGVDAAAPGNHEFDKGLSNLQLRSAESEFPWLSANVIRTGTDWETPDGIEPWRVFRLNNTGVRVGVIGLTQENTGSSTIASGTAGIEFRGAVEAVLRHFDDIANASDYIVVLAHVPLDDYVSPNGTVRPGCKTIASRLASAGKHVDLIIAGHDHLSTPTPILVNDTAIVEAWCYGRYSSRLIVSMDSETLEKTSLRHDLVLMNESSELCEAGTASEIQEIVDKWNEVVEPYVGLLIGETNVSLTRASIYGESILGNLVTNSMKWYADMSDNGVFDGSVKLAFTNTGGIRSDITLASGAASRTIKWLDTFTALPFENTLVLMNITGSTILKVLQANLKSSIFTSGLRYTWVQSGTNSTICNVEVDGEPLSLTQEYLAVTNNFVFGGGDSWTQFQQEATGYWDTGLIDVDSLNTYIMVGLSGKISAEKIPMGRSTIVEACPLGWSSMAPSSSSLYQQQGDQSSSHIFIYWSIAGSLAGALAIVGLAIAAYYKLKKAPTGQGFELVDSA